MKNLFRHINDAEGVKFIDGKRIVDEDISNTPESIKLLKIYRQNIEMFGRPQICLYRNTFLDKDSIQEAIDEFEYPLLRPKIILLDKKEVISFIESEAC